MSVISEVKQEKNGTHLSDRERGRERETWLTLAHAVLKASLIRWVWLLKSNEKFKRKEYTSSRTKVVTSTRQVERIVNQLGAVVHVDKSVVVLQLADQLLPVHFVVVDPEVPSFLQVEDYPFLAIRQGAESEGGVGRGEPSRRRGLVEVRLRHTCIGERHPPLVVMCVCWVRVFHQQKTLL